MPLCDGSSLAVALIDPVPPHGHLWLTSWWVPLAAAAVAAGLAAAWPARGPGATPAEGRFESWDGRLSGPQVATRTLAVAVVALSVAAGRLGDASGIENIAPALVVGAAWPLLVFVSAAGGPIWRWLDPWDGTARLLRAGSGDGREPPDVWPAVTVAVLWAWYLSVYPQATSPRAVGLALAVYAIAMVAGSLAMGRPRWLSRVDAFGLFFGWLGRLPRGALGGWRPPRGAEVLLGALAGGLLFGLVRRSELWGELNIVPGAVVLASIAFAAAAAAVAGTLWGFERWATRRGAPGAVAAAAVPAVGAVALAVAAAAGRVFTSVQLLPRLASDPFGFGWDLFGTVGLPIQAPLGPVRVLALQLAVLLLGHAAGAAAASRRGPAGRLPAAAALGLLMAAAAAAAVLFAHTLLAVEEG